MNLTVPNKISRSICLLALIATGISCSDRNLISMQVELSRSVSKLPFVIAADQGLYEKYGLDVEIKMEPPAFDGGIRMPSNGIGARIWRRIRSITGQQELWKAGYHRRGGECPNIHKGYECQSVTPGLLGRYGLRRAHTHRG